MGQFLATSYFDLIQWGPFSDEMGVGMDLVLVFAVMTSQMWTKSRYQYIMQALREPRIHEEKISHNTQAFLYNRPGFTSSRLPNIPELSWWQTIQLICVFISPKLQLAGYLVGIVIPRYLGIVCKISHYLAKYPAICPVRLHQTKDSHYARTLSKISRANFSRSSFKFWGWISSWWRRDL